MMQPELTTPSNCQSKIAGASSSEQDSDASKLLQQQGLLNYCSSLNSVTESDESTSVSTSAGSISNELSSELSMKTGSSEQIESNFQNNSDAPWMIPLASAPPPSDAGGILFDPEE